MICKTFFRREKSFFSLLLFFIFFSSCQCEKKWETIEIIPTCPYAKTVRIRQPKTEKIHVIAAEFHFDGDEPRMYLNLLLCPVESDEECDQSILVHYRFNETEYEARGYILKGGQKIFMPSNATQEIIRALCSDFCVDLGVADYCTKLEPLNFSSLIP